MRFPKPARARSWKWTLSSLAFVALLTAFFNAPDPGVTAPDVEYVQRVVDGDTLPSSRLRLYLLGKHPKNI
jgi:hypothetical protein